MNHHCGDHITFRKFATSRSCLRDEFLRAELRKRATQTQDSCGRFAALKLPLAAEHARPKPFKSPLGRQLAPQAV